MSNLQMLQHHQCLDFQHVYYKKSNLENILSSLNNVEWSVYFISHPVFWWGSSILEVPAASIFRMVYVVIKQGEGNMDRRDGRVLNKSQKLPEGMQEASPWAHS
jgi:hypothetical protein